MINVFCRAAGVPVENWPCRTASFQKINEKRVVVGEKVSVYARGEGEFR